MLNLVHVFPEKRRVPSHITGQISWLFFVPSKKISVLWTNKGKYGTEKQRIETVFGSFCFIYGYVRWEKSVRIQSYSGPHFPAFGLNIEKTPRLSIQSEWGKIRSRITLNTDTFYVGIYLQIFMGEIMFTLGGNLAL